HQSIALVRENNHRFIDGILKSTPNLFFYQLTIILTFDTSTSSYVPCCNALLIAKTKYIYLRMLHKIIMQLDTNGINCTLYTI
ncbi:hypothetical protein MXB_5259, partial [Myxobolus squamalis]